MCSTEQAVEILGEVCRTCNRVFEKKISDAWLYESYARGDYDKDSDVDILLTVDVETEELPPYRRALSHVRGQLSLKHDVLVSVNVEPEGRFRKNRNAMPYYQNVVQEIIRYTECGNG